MTRVLGFIVRQTIVITLILSLNPFLMGQHDFLLDYAITKFTEVDWLDEFHNHTKIRGSLSADFSEQLDSMVTRSIVSEKLVDKTIYFMNGKEEIEAWYEWSEGWNPTVFRKHQYNIEGLLTELSGHFWDGQIGEWDSPAFSSIKYKYNDSNKLDTLELSFSRALLDSIVNDIEVYEYEDDNLIAAKYYAVHENGSYINLENTDFFYTNNRLHHTKRHILLDNKWFLIDSIAYEYHQNGSVYKRERYLASVWSEGPPILRKSYEYFYENEKLNKIHFKERYDTLTQSLIWLDVLEYNHLPDGSIDSEFSYWDEDAFYPFKGRSYDYDMNIPYSEVRYPRHMLKSEKKRIINHKIDEMKIFIDVDVTQDPPTPKGRYYRFYYSPIEDTSTNEMGSISLMAYPNPTTDHFVLTYSDGHTAETDIVELFDKAGRLLLTQSLTETENRIDVSLLEEGVYFYRVTSGNDIYTGSVVKLN